MRNEVINDAAIEATASAPAPTPPTRQTIFPPTEQEASQPVVGDDGDTEPPPVPSAKTQQSASSRARLIQLLHVAARKATKEQDPWKHRHIDKIPAERVKRWFYNRHNDSWFCDETIVKIEPMPFTKGAMRSCFRLKKRAVLPQSATNTRFHNCNWSTSALNYVAKAYMCPATQEIDVASKAKAQVKNDIVLQHESQHWADKFNDRDPPTRILFLRSYALEFVDRPGTPWLALERFITGRDAYGASFVKHNTNSGFVDVELRRVTPQVFSAFSFYASHGTRLVADIQGVGDLYTDPQVLSDDYRFGDGDLGPRGMALFFRTYRNCGTSDGLGIPTFPLSKNELKVQCKYEDDEITVSDDEDLRDDDNDDLSYQESVRNDHEDDGTTHSSVRSKERLDRFQRLDLNRLRRSKALLHADHPPRHVLTGSIANIEGDSATQVRSNLSSLALSRRSKASHSVSASMNKSSTSSSPSKLPHHRFYRRTRSEIDEVSMCLERAARHREYSMADFHRAPSGELEPRRFKKNSGNGCPPWADANSNGPPPRPFHKSALVRALSSPMVPNEQCRCNLGKVHYQLAVLHGLNRFPEVAEAAALHATETTAAGNGGDTAHDEQCSHVEHDVLSVLFHLSHAASLMNPPACLALGRVLSGRPSSVSTLLTSVVPVDFDLAKELLLRAMATPTLLSKSAARLSVAPKLSAGCLLLALLLEERQLCVQQHNDDESDAKNEGAKVGEASDTAGDKAPPLDGFVRRVLEDTIDLYSQYQEEQRQVEVHRQMRSSCAAPQPDPTALASVLRAGDRVEANYALEGTYYSAVVTDITDRVNDAAPGSGPSSSPIVTVQYDDDGSSEQLPIDQVRIVVPMAATQTRLGGPRLVDDDGCDTNDDEDFDDDVELDCELLLRHYDLLALLAQAHEQDGDVAAAAELYEQAASGAADDGKMQMATAWSLKSPELLLSVK